MYALVICGQTSSRCYSRLRGLLFCGSGVRASAKFEAFLTTGQTRQNILADKHKKSVNTSSAAVKFFRGGGRRLFVPAGASHVHKYDQFTRPHRTLTRGNFTDPSLGDAKHTLTGIRGAAHSIRLEEWN